MGGGVDEEASSSLVKRRKAEEGGENVPVEVFFRFLELLVEVEGVF